MINEYVSAPFIRRLMNRATHADSRVYHLSRTHVESIEKDIDGITCHVGMDGDYYYRLTSEGKEVTVGMNSTRMLECIPKLLTLQELCSLLGEDCPCTQEKKTVFALYTDFEYFDIESKNVYGDMGYSFGGDYDESRREYTQEDDENSVIEEYRNDIIESLTLTPEEEDAENIGIYSIEKKTYEATFDENDEELESEETDEEKNILCYIIACSKERAVRAGFPEEDYSDAEIIYAFDN